MNYEAERAMNQKRLRMEGEPGHGVVQGNGLPLNYMDNGHQIPYQPYAGAYNTHYPPPDAFAAYAPPPGGYAPQNLSYVPPAHQNYPPHHQSFPPQQPPQPQLHMPQSHMVQGYGADVGVHKPAWPPQPHLLPPLDSQKPLDVKQSKPEIKLEPADSQKRPHLPDNEMMGGDGDHPKIKIKTDIFKPDELHRPEVEKAHDMGQKMDILQKPPDLQRIDEIQSDMRSDDKPGDKQSELCKTESHSEESREIPRTLDTPSIPADKDKFSAFDDLKYKTDNERKSTNESFFGTPDSSTFKTSSTPVKTPAPGTEPKKRGRPKGSTNKPKPLPTSMPTPMKVLTPNTPNAPVPLRVGVPPVVRPQMIGRPRGTAYQYAIRPFRKDFSGIQFRRRFSDDCLDSSHIPNEVYFGDVPVSMEVLFNYYDANAEREKLAAQAAQIAAQKAAAAKLAAAKLQARGLISNEVTTVDSSSSDSSSGSEGSDSSESDDDLPLKRGPGRPKGSKNSASPRRSSTSTPGTPGRRGRPPVPPELREPGITEMKKFCKAAGIRFDYKKLTEGCTKNKERVGKMLELLVTAGLEGKPTLEKCKALKQAKVDKKEEEKKAKQEAKTKSKEPEESTVSRRVTRGQTGVKPRQKIVISSDEEDDGIDAKHALAKLRNMVKNESDSN